MTLAGVRLKIVITFFKLTAGISEYRELLTTARLWYNEKQEKRYWTCREEISTYGKLSTTRANPSRRPHE